MGGGPNSVMLAVHFCMNRLNSTERYCRAAYISSCNCLFLWAVCQNVNFLSGSLGDLTCTHIIVFLSAAGDLLRLMACITR